MFINDLQATRDRTGRAFAVGEGGDTIAGSGETSVLGSGSGGGVDNTALPFGSATLGKAQLGNAGFGAPNGICWALASGRLTPGFATNTGRIFAVAVGVAAVASREQQLRSNTGSLSAVSRRIPSWSPVAVRILRRRPRRSRRRRCRATPPCDRRDLSENAGLAAPTDRGLSVEMNTVCASQKSDETPRRIDHVDRAARGDPQTLGLVPPQLVNCRDLARGSRWAQNASAHAHVIPTTHAPRRGLGSADAFCLRARRRFGGGSRLQESGTPSTAR